MGSVRTLLEALAEQVIAAWEWGKANQGPMTVKPARSALLRSMERQHSHARRRLVDREQRASGSIQLGFATE
jgi:hypothetical protein